MQNVFITADQHLDHEGILKYCPRPFDTLEAMNTGLMERWNRVVGRKDVVYVVGDFAWKNHMRWLSRLHGKKILIKGNHDEASQEVYRNFTEVHDLLTRRVNGQEITFCHYAMRTWPGIMNNAWHVYGHSHGRLPEAPNRYSSDVGVDVWDLQPVPFEVLAAKMADRDPDENHDTPRQRIEDLVAYNAQENLRYLQEGA